MRRLDRDDQLRIVIGDRVDQRRHLVAGSNSEGYGCRSGSTSCGAEDPWPSTGHTRRDHPRTGTRIGVSYPTGRRLMRAASRPSGRLFARVQ
jgi:hypothetical protein